jgi:hypothetical protein
MLALLLVALSFASEPNMDNDISSLPGIPERIGNWHFDPSVRICENAEVSVQQVKDSYAIFGVEVEPTVIPACDCTLYPTEIRFVPASCAAEWAPEEKDAYGFTAIHYFPEVGALVSVGVSIVKNDPIVLTHEVGHSLGWLHSSDSDHLMFPFYDLMTNSLTLGMTKE